MALYGAQLWGSQNSEVNARYDVYGSAEAVASGDILSMESGTLEVTDAATEAIAGVSMATLTAAQNDGSTKYLSYIPADENYVWLMGTNSDLTGNSTDYGTFYGITGGTGAQQVNVSGSVTTGTSRQVMILKVDPRGVGGSGADSGLREVLVKFVRVPEFNGAFN